MRISYWSSDVCSSDLAGLAVSPLCEYFTGTPDRHGLLLGYAAVPEDEIERGAMRLAGSPGRPAHRPHRAPDRALQDPQARPPQPSWFAADGQPDRKSTRLNSNH